MSDIFQGPGWWLASDGKWYPPELHYDAAYRAEFAELDDLTVEHTVEPNVTETAEMSEIDLRDALDEIDHLRKEATTEAEPSSTRSAPTVAVPPAEAGTETIDLSDLPDWPPDQTQPPAVDAPNFSVASNPMSKAPERPIFEGTRAPSVIAPSPSPPHPGRTKVEVGTSIDTGVSRTSAGQTPIIGLSTSTEIEPFRAPSRFGYTTARQRIVAALLFLSGVTMIVGAFLNWTIGAVVETGWARGDGIVAIIAGVAGAAAAGPIALGLRHSFPKGVAIVGGAVGLMVAGLGAVGGVLDESVRGVRLGPGLLVVTVAALFMIIGGIADQGDDYA